MFSRAKLVFFAVCIVAKWHFPWEINLSDIYRHFFVRAFFLSNSRMSSQLQCNKLQSDFRGFVFLLQNFSWQHFVSWKVGQQELGNWTFITTKRCGPLRGPPSSSCGGHRPSTKAFFQAKKKKFFLYYLGKVKCSVVTLLTFRRNMSNFFFLNLNFCKM